MVLDGLGRRCEEGKRWTWSIGSGREVRTRRVEPRKSNLNEVVLCTVNRSQKSTGHSAKRRVESNRHRTAQSDGQTSEEPLGWSRGDMQHLGEELPNISESKAALQVRITR